MFSRDHRQHVAWDIETTGLGWSDRITVSGFWLPHGVAEIVLNTAGDTIDTDVYEQYLESHCGIPITLHSTSTESELLEQMHHIIFERFERERDCLIGYNADSWKGGFDLPFLRTACVRCGVEWVFDGLEFSDAWEVVKKRLNTAEPGTATDGSGASSYDLNTAHTILCAESNVRDALGSEISDDHTWYSNCNYDPFADSSEAVEFFNRGEYLPIVQHNIVDIHRTWELSAVIREFVSPRDITSKKL